MRCLSSLSVASFIIASSAALACPHYTPAVSAVNSGDVETATTLYEEIVVSAECGDPLREWVADFLAKSSFIAAMQDGSTANMRRSGLKKALTYEPHWRSYAELGRLEWSEGRYALAAHNLQLALNELDEGDPGHPADTSEIAEIYELATASLALADEAIDMPRTRSGQPGGIFKTSIRGFSVEEVHLPITFEYNSTNFDELGAQYADALAEHLGALSAGSVELGGHTDPRGGEDFNLDLSERRAAALRDFLKDKGFAGEISIKGYGETQLPVPPDGVEEGSEEHFRIARRVAFKTQ